MLWEKMYSLSQMQMGFMVSPVKRDYQKILLHICRLRPDLLPDKQHNLS